MSLSKSPVTVIEDNMTKFTQALTLHLQGELDHAAALYQDILQSEPQHFDALQLLASIAGQRKDSLAALALFDQALAVKPDHAETLNNHGNVLRDLKRLDEALKSYDRALDIKPNYTDALTNRGNVLQDLKRYSEALMDYDRALAIRSDLADVLLFRGNALQKLDRYSDALQSYDLARKLNPNCVETLNNRGLALQKLNRPVEALACYDTALTIDARCVASINNRGLALFDLHRFADALDCYEQVLSINPQYNNAHWNESCVRLLTGDFKIGWAKYEWRWIKEPKLAMFRQFSKPHWLGKEALTDKTILLYTEQGLGDTIQFCRYAKQVAALGGKVILVVQPSLKTLLQNLEGVSMIFSLEETLPAFDYHCPLLSLPLACGTEVETIDGATYLYADQKKYEQWQTKFNQSYPEKIGLVWQGSPLHSHDHNRSIPLEKFKDLVDDHAEYCCLQKELLPSDQAILQSMPKVRFFGAELHDFSDTAALVACMDIVITVDTSVAHLAGAMGKEVWILLPFTPEWRWLLDRNDSPWYPSARLFRQPSIGDWDSVLAQVKLELTARRLDSSD